MTMSITGFITIIIPMLACLLIIGLYPILRRFKTLKPLERHYKTIMVTLTSLSAISLFSLLAAADVTVVRDVKDGIVITDRNVAFLSYKGHPVTRGHQYIDNQTDNLIALHSDNPYNDYLIKPGQFLRTAVSVSRPNFLWAVDSPEGGSFMKMSTRQ